MSKTAAKIVDDDLKIILYDPLVPMLKNTDRLFNKKLDSACGVLNTYHFKTKNSTQCYQDIHYVMQLVLNCNFRNARVLKEDGKWIIVDLGKPDESFLDLSYIYLRMILPIIAFAAGGRLGLKFGHFMNIQAKNGKN